MAFRLRPRTDLEVGNTGFFLSTQCFSADYADNCITSKTSKQMDKLTGPWRDRPKVAHDTEMPKFGLPPPAGVFQAVSAMDFLGDVLRTGFQLLFMAVFLGGMAILFLIPVVLVVYTFMDIFNRDDIAVGKLLWSLVVLLVPFAGLGIYWLARPAGEQAPATTMSMHRGTPAPEAETPAVDDARAAPRRAA